MKVRMKRGVIRMKLRAFNEEFTLKRVKRFKKNAETRTILSKM